MPFLVRTNVKHLWGKKVPCAFCGKNIPLPRLCNNSRSCSDKCQGKLAYQESRGVDLSNGSPKQQVAMAEKKKKYHYKYNKKYNKAKQAVKKEEKLAAKAQRNKEIDELFDDI